MTYGDELFSLLESTSNTSISVSGVGRRSTPLKGGGGGGGVDNTSSAARTRDARKQEKVNRETREEYARAMVKAERAAGAEYDAEEAEERRDQYEKQYDKMGENQQNFLKDVYGRDLKPGDRAAADAAKEDPDNPNEASQISKGEFQQIVDDYVQDTIDSKVGTDVRYQEVEDVVYEIFENEENQSFMFSDGVAKAAAKGAAGGGGGEEAGDAPPFTDAQVEALNQAIADFLAGFKCDCSHCSCEGGGS